VPLPTIPFIPIPIRSNPSSSPSSSALSIPIRSMATHCVCMAAMWSMASVLASCFTCGLVAFWSASWPSSISPALTAAITEKAESSAGDSVR
jgi:hypothetical protein